MIIFLLLVGFLAIYLVGKDHLSFSELSTVFVGKKWYSAFMTPQYQSFVIHYIVLSLSILALTTMFHLSVKHMILLLIISWCGLPLVLLYQLKYRFYANEFHQCTQFLQHFLAHFKTHQKVFLAYSESKSYVDERLLPIVESMIEVIEQKGDVLSSFQVFYDLYPHFIVKNIQTFVSSCEMFGSLGSHDAIELLEDDIDDWIEDTMIWIEERKRMKQRMILLCLMSCVIALLNQSMLTSFFDLTLFDIYHHVITAFLLVVFVTILVAFRLLSSRWIVMGDKV
ncbi:MAG TPA: hypothetical protein DEA51_04515 [Erysipelotrichaceae bacterium]|nr:hypothetical protein [Erysipelotrichaceae bacterium]